MGQSQAHSERIMLPFSLKKVLVDEWELIAHVNMLPTLPSAVTVKAALDQYLQGKLEMFPVELKTNFREIEAMHKQRKNWLKAVEGIAMYFDNSIVHILYRHEIPQLRKMHKESKRKKIRKCEIYGCEHLLRLF